MHKPRADKNIPINFSNSRSHSCNIPFYTQEAKRAQNTHHTKCIHNSCLYSLPSPTRRPIKKTPSLSCQTHHYRSPSIRSFVESIVRGPP
ncbi:hypothetical protein BS50DRAFT_239639 [Corynespora cassiicola Philippines]|uniref:Uncharacterized protein n=1 Tax=Corynespora cassiicola Philippines TaxID=1448308 RepID=A0A2T2P340_CORCC|nr:hypothetical protein BS50DRAFT_239639 [Corynespora cassiicola Philippines]